MSFASRCLLIAHSTSFVNKRTDIYESTWLRRILQICVMAGEMKRTVDPSTVIEEPTKDSGGFLWSIRSDYGVGTKRTESTEACFVTHKRKERNKEGTWQAYRKDISRVYIAHYCCGPIPFWWITASIYSNPHFFVFSFLPADSLVTVATISRHSPHRFSFSSALISIANFSPFGFFLCVTSRLLRASASRIRIGLKRTEAHCKLLKCV